MNNYVNPFITSGYVSSEYFCDREEETRQLIKEVKNGNNLALISTRRMGKTGLIKHCFNYKEIQEQYRTFFVDIYATKSLRDFVFALSKVLLEGLKPFGISALEKFWNYVKSLRAGIAFDPAGNPSFNIGLGDIHEPQATLDEIFTYLNKSDKPCLVAIDEFQQIASYTEENVEAILRTYIQHSNNVHFIFAGSQHHTIGNIFLSASRPFYQSVSMMYLKSIPVGKYAEFARSHFEHTGKTIHQDTIENIYHQFDGITWYLQKMLNVLYEMTPKGAVCDRSLVTDAVENILNTFQYAYSEMIFRLPEKQKELLVAIAKEGKVKAITSGAFVKRYKLQSASSVQAALKALLEKDFITKEKNEYQVYDRFFAIWLKENY
ncbi:MAG: ATPase [Lentimicrobiaceae bacterium]|nr:ATPase [Lentimicrobiaceae bacterium]